MIREKPLRCGPVCLDEPGKPVGGPPALFDERVVEREGGKTGSGEAFAQPGHEGMALPGTGPVRQQDCRRGGPIRHGEQTGDLLAGLPFDAQTSRLHAGSVPDDTRTLDAVRTLIYDTPADVANAASGFVAGALATLGDSTLALAGGGTPRATHDRLRTAAVDWDHVTMWLADERWVASDHEESNARMARETLVDNTGSRLVAPVFGDDPHDAAAAYAVAIDEIWIERDGVAAPDIVMLGLGEDGHTASLFPSTAALTERGTTYVANWVAAKQAWRLTATMRLLWTARTILFLVTGQGKADMVARIIDDEQPYPAWQVSAGARGEVLWMLDEAAASRLRRPC